MGTKYKFQDYETVWQRSLATGNDLLLLLALVKFRTSKGMWATKETLAQLMNCNVDTVERSIKRLRDLGELSWQSGSSFGKRANVYKINLLGLDHDPANCTRNCTRDCGFNTPQTHPLNPRNITPLNSNETEMKLSEKREVFVSDFWPSEWMLRESPFSVETLAWARSFGFGSPHGISYLRLVDLFLRFESHVPNRGKVGVERARLFGEWVRRDVAEFGAARTEGDRA